MKKTDIALIVGVLLIVIIGVFAFGKTEAKEYEFPLTLKGEAGLKEITYKEYEEKIESQEPFIFIVERTGCSYCEMFMPVAEQFTKDYNIPIYYINTDNITSEEFTSLEKSNTFFKKNPSNWGTPTTMILVGSKSIDELAGATEAEGLYEFLSEYFELESSNN